MSNSFVTDPEKQREIIKMLVEDLIGPSIGKPMKISTERDEVLLERRPGDKMDRYGKGDLRIMIEFKMRDPR